MMKIFSCFSALLVGSSLYGADVLELRPEDREAKKLTHAEAKQINPFLSSAQPTAEPVVEQVVSENRVSSEEIEKFKQTMISKLNAVNHSSGDSSIALGSRVFRVGDAIELSGQNGENQAVLAEPVVLSEIGSHNLVLEIGETATTVILPVALQTGRLHVRN